MLFFNRFSARMDAIEIWCAINALGIKPFRDGNQWCFLYGDNLQEGIAGFGDTIFDAAWDFYANLLNEK